MIIFKCALPERLSLSFVWRVEHCQPEILVHFAEVFQSRMCIGETIWALKTTVSIFLWSELWSLYCSSTLMGINRDTANYHLTSHDIERPSLSQSGEHIFLVTEEWCFRRKWPIWAKFDFLLSYFVCWGKSGHLDVRCLEILLSVIMIYSRKVLPPSGAIKTIGYV
jgi:hypothetical protein